MSASNSYEVHSIEKLYQLRRSQNEIEGFIVILFFSFIFFTLPVDHHVWNQSLKSKEGEGLLKSNDLHYADAPMMHEDWYTVVRSTLICNEHIGGCAAWGLSDTPRLVSGGYYAWEAVEGRGRDKKRRRREKIEEEEEEAG